MCSGLRSVGVWLGPGASLKPQALQINVEIMHAVGETD